MAVWWENESERILQQNGRMLTSCQVESLVPSVANRRGKRTTGKKGKGGKDTKNKRNKNKCQIQIRIGLRRHTQGPVILLWHILPYSCTAKMKYWKVLMSYFECRSCCLRWRSVTKEKGAFASSLGISLFFLRGMFLNVLHHSGHRQPITPKGVNSEKGLKNTGPEEELMMMVTRATTGQSFAGIFYFVFCHFCALCFSLIWGMCGALYPSYRTIFWLVRFNRHKYSAVSINVCVC